MLDRLNNFTHRRFYRGQRPNWIGRLINRFFAALHSVGILPDYMVTLEVIGRKTGRLVTLPVAIARVNGQRYLVSMLGNEAQWVQNVRAAHGRAFIRRGGRTAVQLEEVPVDQRASILKAYLQRAPGARPHIPVDKDAPVAAFEAVAPSFPVFRIVLNGVE
ncbi:MAG: nitroreductase family deazaflavin-dependent oxidoreductase [Anaerolineae bacterium]|nr:nitroreductase family deazaflavin-dependent oxidoreductase [Anaerolineae bacterium]